MTDPTPEVEAGERETLDARVEAYLDSAPGGREAVVRWIATGDPAPSQSPQGSELGDGAVEALATAISIIVGEYAAKRPDSWTEDEWLSYLHGLGEAKDKAAILAAGYVSPEQAREREAAAVKAALLSAADEMRDWFPESTGLRDRLIRPSILMVAKWLTDRANRSEEGRA